MKQHWLLSTLFFFSTFLNAQDVLFQTIKGIVVDGDSKRPIAGVTVTINGTSKKAISDANGYYSISLVPIGRQTIIFESIGYERKYVSEILFTTAKEVEVNIGMTERIHKLTDIVVKTTRNRTKALNDFASASARQFSVEDTKRYPATAFDPARMASNFAGVSSNGDFQNAIVVRGNTPSGVLWRLEGIEIPNPNHYGFLGSTGGAISMLSSSTLGSSDFYTGAFPAEIGNATSGVFDLNFRNGNKNKAEHSIMIGALGIEAASEGPLNKSKKASYLVNLRYSTLAVLKNFVDVGNTVPDYQDISFKFNFPTQKWGLFQVFGILGTNKSSSIAIKDSTKWNDDEPNLTSSIKGGTGVVGFSHQYFINSKSFIKTTLAASGTNFNGYYDTLNPSNNYVAFRTRIADQKDRAYRVSILYNSKFNSAATLRAGVIASKLTFNLNENYFDDNLKVWKTYFKSNGNTEFYQTYIQLKYRLTEKFTMNTGVHGSLWAYNNTYAIDPRLSFSYSAGDNQTIHLAMGLYSKPENIATYVFDGTTVGSTNGGLNKSLEMSKAAHIVLGYEKTLNNRWRVKAEAYYQYLYNIPVEEKVGSWFSVINKSIIYDLADVGKLVNKGTGTNYGVDITVEKPFSDNYYLLFTGSFYDSKFKTYEGVEYNTRFNGNYQSNFVMGKEWKKGKLRKNIFGVNGKINTSGGLRNSPIDLVASAISGKTEYQPGKYYTIQGAAYFRLDIGFSYKINKKNSTHTIMLDFQNLTDHKNVFTQYFDKKTASIKNQYQLGLLPFINYRIEF